MEGGNPQYNLELVMAFSKAKGSPAPGRLDGEPFALLKTMSISRSYCGYLLPFWALQHFATVTRSFSTWSNQMELQWNWFGLYLALRNAFWGWHGLSWKAKGSPSARGAWTGEPFTFYERPCPTPECVPPEPSITQISYTGVTFWLDHVENERVTIDYLNSRRSIPIFWVTLASV